MEDVTTSEDKEMLKEIGQSIGNTSPTEFLEGLIGMEVDCNILIKNREIWCIAII